MVADTYSPILGLILQGTGNNNNTWGDTWNNSAGKIIDRAIAGIIARPTTGGTIDLSGSPPPAAARQDLDMIQDITGALVSSVTIIVPNLSKTWLFRNSTTGGFYVYVKTTTGNTVQIPQSTTKFLFCDGANVIKRLDDDQIGMFRHRAGGSVIAGELICSGQSLIRADFPELFARIGVTWGAVDGTHFTLPNLTDTGRYMRSSIPGTLNTGNYQSNLVGAHSHAVTGAPSAGSLGTSDPGNHTHINSLNESPHSHTLASGNGAQRSGQLVTSGSGSAGQGVIALGSTDTALTGVSINNAAAGAHTHTITGAPGAGTLGTASTGGTETRPETIVVTVAIVY